MLFRSLARCKRDIQRLRERVAMCGPGVRVQTQAVMNVQRDDTRSPRASNGGIEQRGRVETAAEGNGDAGFRRSQHIDERRAHRIDHEAAGGSFNVGGCHGSRLVKLPSRHPARAHCMDATVSAALKLHAPGRFSLNLPYAISLSKRRARTSSAFMPWN